jgi:hypothetical protein
MGFSLFGSKNQSKTKTSSTTNTHSTTTPTVPQWASTLSQDVAGRVGEINRLDPQSLFAPAHALQQQAGEGAAGLTGWRDTYQGAADLLGAAGQRDAFTYAPSLGSATSYEAGRFGGASVGPAASLLDNLSAYYNPYRDQITNPVLADLDVNAGRTRAQQDLDLAGSGAFGGSGAALTRSMTEGELARARAATLSGLLGDMFKTSTSLADSDAGRRQQTTWAQAGFEQEAGLANAAALNQARAFGASAGNTQALANQSALNEAGRYNAQAGEAALARQTEAARGMAGLAGDYEANQRANIAAQAGVGETLRGIDQQQRQAPITHAQQVVAMLSGLPINLFVGEERTGTEQSNGTSKSKSLTVEGGYKQ